MYLYEALEYLTDTYTGADTPASL